MNEAKNVEVIQSIYGAFGRGEIPYIIGLLTDDVRWSSHFEAIVPWSGDWSGKDKVPGFFKAMAGSVDVTAFVPRELVSQGDTVVSIGEFGCTVRATGKSALTRWVFIWKLREGKVYSYEQFHEPTIAAAFR